MSVVRTTRRRRGPLRETGALPEPEGGERRVRLGYADAGPFTMDDVTRCAHGEPVVFNCVKCDLITARNAERLVSDMAGVG